MDQTAHMPYVGEELGLFEHAQNWKRYFASRLKPHIRGEVCEVGAGTGTTTKVLCDGTPQRWVGLEPDPALVDQFKQRMEREPLPMPVDIRVATLSDVPEDEVFDTIIYIDVLEHIKDDRGELENAARHLKPQGRIVVLCPAHQWLYSPFDEALLHYRRYNRRMYREVTPNTLRLVECYYLDAVGLLASSGNRLLLSQSKPTVRQIKTWDRYMVPVSRVIDPLIGRTLGKTVVGVWTHAGTE